MTRIRLIALLLSSLLLAGCQDPELYSNLDEQQANEVEAALLSRGIEARKVRAEKGEAFLITVPREDIPDAMATLTNLGLPRHANPSMGDIFKKEGFVSSPTEERARYLHALSQELATTLMQIDGVVTARVHVALPDKHVLQEDVDSASVSVVIIQQPGADLSGYETDIKAIITDGVEGLNDVNRVTVRFFSRELRQAAAEAETPLAMGAVER
tara:strand:- start:22277 stop:22915 length:639 start_codon:yes stop_codon:yes gene_type:complete